MVRLSLRFLGFRWFLAASWILSNALVLDDRILLSASATECDFDVRVNSSDCDQADSDCAAVCAHCGTNPIGEYYLQNDHNTVITGSMMVSSLVVDVDCYDAWTCTTEPRLFNNCLTSPTGTKYCNGGHPESNCYNCVAGTPETIMIQNPQVAGCNQE